jgi:hypothetical protein
MALAFNGTDLSWAGSAMEIVDITYTSQKIPRVDITNAGSTFRQYGAGIPDAEEVSVTHLAAVTSPGQTGVFSSGTVAITGTFRVESVEISGSLDNPQTFTSTFVRIS